MCTDRYGGLELSFQGEGVSHVGGGVSNFEGVSHNTLQTLLAARLCVYIMIRARTSLVRGYNRGVHLFELSLSSRVQRLVHAREVVDLLPHLGKQATHPAKSPSPSRTDTSTKRVLKRSESLQAFVPETIGLICIPTVRMWRLSVVNDSNASRFC